MLEIEHIEQIDAVEVQREEKIRKGEYKKKQLVERQVAELEQNDKKQAELKARMDRVV